MAETPRCPSCRRFSTVEPDVLIGRHVCLRCDLVFEWDPDTDTEPRARRDLE